MPDSSLHISFVGGFGLGQLLGAQSTDRTDVKPSRTLQISIACASKFEVVGLAIVMSPGAIRCGACKEACPGLDQW